jgi:probable rRNA maturation factor
MARLRGVPRRRAAAAVDRWLEVQRPTRGRRTPSRRDVLAWAGAALAAAGRSPGDVVTLRFVGSAEGARLNGRWRGGSGPPNVLAFPAAAGTGELGDIVICLPVANREARERGRTARAHLAHLVVHGTLHLLGYDHQRPAPARRMERLEAQVLADLGFDDPYETAPPGPSRRRGSNGR